MPVTAQQSDETGIDAVVVDVRPHKPSRALSFVERGRGLPVFRMAGSFMPITSRPRSCLRLSLRLSGGSFRQYLDRILHRLKRYAPIIGKLRRRSKALDSCTILMYTYSRRVRPLFRSPSVSRKSMKSPIKIMSGRILGVAMQLLIIKREMTNVRLKNRTKADTQKRGCGSCAVSLTTPHTQDPGRKRQWMLSGASAFGTERHEVAAPLGRFSPRC